MMGQQLFDLVFGTLAQAFTAVLWLRVLMQAQRISFYTPLGRFVLALTDWAVLPLRRALKPRMRWDGVSLGLAWATQSLFVLLKMAVFGQLALLPLGGLAGLVVLGGYSRRSTCWGISSFSPSCSRRFRVGSIPRRRPQCSPRRWSRPGSSRSGASSR